MPTVELGLRPKKNRRHGVDADGWRSADGQIRYADRRYADGATPTATVGTTVRRRLAHVRRRLVAVGI
jgi:hypothetical protein